MIPLVTILAVYCGVMYLFFRVVRQKPYKETVQAMEREFPNCQFVILYGVESLKPYGFTWEPKLGMLLIVDIQTTTQFSRVPERVSEVPGGLPIASDDIPDLIKEKLNVPQS